MEISIYDKSGNLVATVVVGSNSYTLNEIMGDAYLQLEFSLGEYIDIRRDSYCVYNGVRYTLIKAVNVEKISTVEYKYSARFEAPQELLENIIMSHMAGEGQITTKAYERNFQLAGTAQEHIEMLLRNTAERLHTNFHLGTIDESLTGVKVVAYNVVSCKSALQLIANAFECEWWVSGNESEGYAINLGKCSFEEDTPTKLAYGHDNGVLGGTKRQLHKDAQRMTHIAIQGGSQNINTLSQLEYVPPYKFSTLHLPKTQDYDDTTGIGHIYYDVKNNKFEGETGFNMSTSVLLAIDRNANTMTSSLFNEAEDVIVERAFDLSEFYPKKSRFVTAFSFQRNDTEFYIEDSTIEDACDYKHYQLGGEKITIVFQTGALAGKTFDVINYDHENRRFECALADYDTISMPSVDEEVWRPVVGEEFIVYGTALPKTYFADTSTDPYSGAEWDMARRTASILCENFNDKYAYSLTIDSNWLSRRTIEQRNALKCGFWVHFVDNQLAGGGVDIRITAVKEYLTRPLQPELTIGDEVKTVSIAQKLQQIQSNVSATYNYVQNVQEQTQQAIHKVENEGVGGKVDDVRVNGTSVVTDKIADIQIVTPSDYAVVKTLANGTDLNTVKQVGFYNALGNHNCVNAHSSANPFGLQVIHTAGTDYYTQIIYDYWGKVYRRFGKAGVWTAWKECVADWDETDQYSPAFIKNKPTIPAEITSDTVEGWGYTKNQGTITEVKLNGASVATSGSADINASVNKRINGGTDLNTLLESGFYYCASNHNCVNAHSTVNPFGLVVVHSALGDYYAQIIFDYWGKIYHRYKGGQSNTWTAWTERKIVTETDVSGWGFTKNAGTITEVKFNGTSLATSGSVNITAPVSKQLTSGSLNNVTDPGIYFAGGGNACSNVATSVGNAFGLIVTKTAGSNYYQQTFFDYFGKEFKRFCKGGTWSAWKSAQANWNETDTNSSSYIQNKPNLDNYMLKSDALSALFLGKITLYLDAYAKNGVMQYCHVTLRDSEYLNGWTLTDSTYNVTDNKFRCDVVLTNSGISLTDFVSSHTYITLVTAGTTYSVNNLSSITHVNIEGSGSKVTFLIDIGTLKTSGEQWWSSNIMISMVK